MEKSKCEEVSLIFLKYSFFTPYKLLLAIKK